MATQRKMSHEEFCLVAIEKLRKDGYKGIHLVYSGFNQAFKEYFGEDPRAITERLATEGKIVIRPCKGGAIMYKPEEAPRAGKNVLEQMGIK